MKTYLSTLTLFLLMSLSNSINCQTFERTYTADSLIPPCHSLNLSFGIDIMKVPGGYMFLAKTNTGYLPSCNFGGFSGYELVKLNDLGDTIFSKLFLEPTAIYDTIGPVPSLHPNDFTMASDGSIYVTGTCLDDTTTMFLNKHNFMGDLLWSKSFLINDVTNGHAVYVDSNSVYVGGMTGISFTGQRPCVVKFDTAGNHLWDYTYTNSQFATISSIHKIANSFFITGWLRPVSGFDHHYAVFAAKFDSTGNFSPFVFYGDSTFEYDYVSSIVDDSNNIIISAQENSANYNNLILKIDTSLAVLNQFLVQGQSPTNFYESYSVDLLSDGNYVLVGSKDYYATFWGIYVYATSIYVQKLNPSGNIIWEQEYSGYNPNVLALDSNEFIIVGWRHDTIINEQGYYQTLVIKTDSLGESYECIPYIYPSNWNTIPSDSFPVGSAVYLVNTSYGTDTFQWQINDTLFSTGFNDYFFVTDTGWMEITLIGCNDTITDSIFVFQSTVNVNNETDMADLIIYPNPTSNFVNIEIIGDQEDKNIELHVYSLDGRTMHTTLINDKTVLDVAGWSSGLYFYRIKLPDGRNKSGKFIKN